MLDGRNYSIRAPLFAASRSSGSMAVCTIGASRIEVVQVIVVAFVATNILRCSFVLAFLPCLSHKKINAQSRYHIFLPSIVHLDTLQHVQFQVTVKKKVETSMFVGETGTFSVLLLILTCLCVGCMEDEVAREENQHRQQPPKTKPR